MLGVLQKKNTFSYRNIFTCQSEAEQDWHLFSSRFEALRSLQRWEACSCSLVLHLFWLHRFLASLFSCVILFLLRCFDAFHTLQTIYKYTHEECLLWMCEMTDRQKVPQKYSDWLNKESDGSHFLFDCLQRRDFFLLNWTYLLSIWATIFCCWCVSIFNIDKDGKLLHVWIANFNRFHVWKCLTIKT